MAISVNLPRIDATLAPASCVVNCWWLGTYPGVPAFVIRNESVVALSSSIPGNLSMLPLFNWARLPPQLMGKLGLCVLHLEAV